MVELRSSPNFFVIKKTGVESNFEFLKHEEACNDNQIQENQPPYNEPLVKRCDQHIHTKFPSRTALIIKYQFEKNGVDHILNNYNKGEIHLDSLYFWFLLSELRNSTVYRKLFVKKWHRLLLMTVGRKFSSENICNAANFDNVTRSHNAEVMVDGKVVAESPSDSDCEVELIAQTPVLTVFLVDSTPSFIDKRWCSMLCQSVVEVAQLDSFMSWLSTLGGACSALGDHSLTWADKAAAISARQLVIANRLGDPSVVARCRLYAAIALIQKRDWKTAAAIIRREDQAVKKLPPEMQDGRLVKMCLGIWTKLSYERSIEKLA